jgi:thioesterase III
MTTQYTKFTYPILIREHHLDTFGHVNNATYLELLEEARWEFITGRGFGIRRIQESGLGPTILEINIKFKKEIRLREDITIESQITSFNRKIAYLKQVIINSNAEVAAEAELVMGFFDLNARKLVIPTDEWMYAIGVS